MARNIQSINETEEQIATTLGSGKQKGAQESEEHLKDSEADQEIDDQEIDDAASSEEEDDETESESATEQDEDDEDDKPKKKAKRGGYKRRVAKLAAKLSRKDQEIEYWRQKALEKEQASKKQVKSEESDEKSKESAKKADSRPSPEDYDDAAEYIEALTDWKLDKRLEAKEKSTKQKTEAEKEVHRIEELTAQYQKNYRQYSKENPDFLELAQDLVDEGVQLGAELELAVLELGDTALPVLHELIKDVDMLEKMQAMKPQQLYRALGRIESKLEKGAASEGSKSVSQSSQKAKMSSSTTSRPLKPIKGGSVGGTKKPEEMDFQEFKRWRANQQRI